MEWIKESLDNLTNQEATANRLMIFNELQRRKWIIDGVLEHNHHLKDLILTYLDHKKIDIVPKDYKYHRIMLKW